MAVKVEIIPKLCAVDYDHVIGRPSSETYADIDHEHEKADITDFAHTHVWADITKGSNYNSTNDTYAPSAHNHSGDTVKPSQVNIKVTGDNTRSESTLYAGTLVIDSEGSTNVLESKTVGGNIKLVSAAAGTSDPAANPSEGMMLAHGGLYIYDTSYDSSNPWKQRVSKDKFEMSTTSEVSSMDSHNIKQTASGSVNDLQNLTTAAGVFVTKSVHGETDISAGFKLAADGIYAREDGDSDWTQKVWADKVQLAKAASSSITKTGTLTPEEIKVTQISTGSTHYSARATPTGLVCIQTSDAALETITKGAKITNAGFAQWNTGTGTYSTMADFVIEQGEVDAKISTTTVGKWKYRIWYSGKEEAWFHGSFSGISVNTAIGSSNLYRGDIANSIIYPDVLTNDTYKMQYIDAHSTSDNANFLMAACVPATTTTGVIYGVSPISFTGATVRLHIYVVTR